MDHPAETCLGPLEDLRLYQRRRAVVAGQAVAVFALEDGSVCAIADECPHYGASLSEGRYRPPYVECPWHRWLIDVRTGRPLHGGRPADCTVEVAVREGLVYLSARSP